MIFGLLSSGCFHRKQKRPDADCIRPLILRLD
jgi:hypothetical protein